jgi:uncharacterized membrane protein YeiH
MPAIPVVALDCLGVAVFAATGALVASRKQMDLIGFALLATLTAIGGGAIRDVAIGRAVFWIADPSYLAVCLAIALVSCFAAQLLQRRDVVLWMDALGLAAYGAMACSARISRSLPASGRCRLSCSASLPRPSAA